MRNLKFRIPKLIRTKPIIALGAAGAALVAGVALAAWVVITMTSVGPSTFGTSQVQNGVVGAYVPRLATDCGGGTAPALTPLTANIWTARPAASPGDVSTGKFCLINDSPTPVVGITYALTSTNTSAILSAGLVARVVSCGYGETTVCSQTDSLNADGSAKTLSGDDVSIYMGPLSTLLTGNPAQGAQAGDRALGKTNSPCTTTACARELMQITVVLPTAADSSLAGLTNDFTLQISASP